jgi:hypothetical protein
MHKSGNNSEQGPLGGAQAQPDPHRVGVSLLTVEVAGIERVRQMRISAWVPVLVDPVHDPRQLAPRRSAFHQSMQPGAWVSLVISVE